MDEEEIEKINKNNGQPQTAPGFSLPKAQESAVSPSNKEIEEALKRFQEKYRIEQQQKKPLLEQQKSETTKMVRFVMKYSGGLIKSEKTAQYVLLIFVVIAMSISVYLFLTGGKRQQYQNTTTIMPEQTK
jgi:hypothetical protein